MTDLKKSKPIFDLEKRTFEFAKDIRLFCKSLPKSIINFDDTKQLIRPSGSIGANYIEANEALGHKDFLIRLRISRKEAKESIYWLRLISETTDFENDNQIKGLIQEVTELTKILSSITINSKTSKKSF